MRARAWSLELGIAQSRIPLRQRLEPRLLLRLVLRELRFLAGNLVGKLDIDGLLDFTLDEILGESHELRDRQVATADRLREGETVAICSNMKMTSQARARALRVDDRRNLVREKRAALRNDDRDAVFGEALDFSPGLHGRGSARGGGAGTGVGIHCAFL